MRKAARISCPKNKKMVDSSADECRMMNVVGIPKRYNLL